MSGRRTIGMSRREVERDLKWILRNPPSDPAALTKALIDAVSTIVERNNRAIAAALERDEDDGLGGEAP